MPTVVVVSSSSAYRTTCEDAHVSTLDDAVSQLGSLKPAIVVFENGLDRSQAARVRDVAVAVGARVLSDVPLHAAARALRAALEELTDDR